VNRNFNLLLNIKLLRDRFDKASVNYAVKLPQAISAQEIWMLNEIFDENGPFSKVNRNQV
jgi:hypothetical protein